MSRVMLIANNPNSIGSIPYRLNGNVISYRLIPPKKINDILPNNNIVFLKSIIVFLYTSYQVLIPIISVFYKNLGIVFSIYCYYGY